MQAKCGDVVLTLKPKLENIFDVISVIIRSINERLYKAALINE